MGKKRKQSSPAYLDWTQYRRVFQKASTPAPSEFKRVSLVSAAGLVLVGVIGFTIFSIMSLIPF